ncbi:hypothetical protein JYT83_00575 [bacterium AH-315-F18]|nr:hypothetical protein [bacterium AH-315-F18]
MAVQSRVGKGGRMKRIIPLLAVLFLGGCTSVEYTNTRSKIPIFFTPIPEGKKVARIVLDATKSWAFWGIWTISEPDVAALVEAEAKALGADAVGNLRLSEGITTQDMGINLIIAHLYGGQSYSIRIEADAYSLGEGAQGP